MSLGRVANAASVTGKAATRQIAASTRNATRHPYEAMTALVMGDRITPPTPEPERAIETAKPRLSVNQFEMTTDTSRRVPATTTMPATMHST